MDPVDSALLDRIPLRARRVLHFAGPTSPLAEAYGRRNPAGRVVAMPDDPDAANLVEGAGLAGPGDAECLIYGAALNRCADPAAMLRRHMALLAETGVVLIALPNPDHWRWLDRSLRGGWDYEGAGADLPVARPGWPRAAVERMIAAAGLHLIDAAPVDPDIDGAETFVHVLGPSLWRLGVDRAHLLQRIAPRAWVWRARRQPRQPIHIYGNMLAPVGGVSHVRVIEPMRALLSEPDAVTTVLGFSQPPPADVPQPKIFIMHRPVLTGDNGLAVLRQYLDNGWLVVCEFDDHPDQIELLHHPEVYNFQGVHAIQTSTGPLAAFLRQQNPEIGLFPNSVAELPDAANYTDPEVFTLLCAGLNRQDDTMPFAKVLNAVAAKAGGRLRFRIVGDQALHAALTTPHKSYLPVCAYDTYLALLATSEISFMPLRDTAFNRCKSDLKFIEAAAHRVTALASDVVYQDSIEDRRTGLLFANAEELEHNLTRLLERPGWGRTLADNARTYVRNRRMAAGQVGHRMAWYRSLIARKDALSAALAARVPALADAAAGE